MWIRPSNATKVAAVLAALFSCPAILAEQPKQDTQTLSITYIANEGLLLQAGDDIVLIDALFRGGVSGYARVEPATLESLETAEAPFDAAKAVLVTHYHADHFNAESVARYLTSNPGAALYTSEQVAEPVRVVAKSDAGVADRIHGYQPSADEPITVSASGIKIELIKLSHGGGRFASVWNLGYIVHLGGKRILHIGDAHFIDASTKPLERCAKNVDVACIPYWWLLDEAGRTYVAETLKPKHVVAIHIPPREAADVTTKIRPHFPDAMICTAPMQRKSF